LAPAPQLELGNSLSIGKARISAASFPENAASSTAISPERFGVAIGDEFQCPRRTRRSVGMSPHPGLAAENAVLFGLEVLIEWRQRAADLDQVCGAIDRIVELGRTQRGFRGSGTATDIATMRTRQP